MTDKPSRPSSRGRRAPVAAPRHSHERSSGGSRPNDRQNDLARVYGLHACKALSDRRRDQVVRAFFTEAASVHFKSLMQYLAAHKKPYRLVGEDEVQKVSQTERHEGVCLVVEPRKPISLDACMRQVPRGASDLLVVLDRPGNAHTIGAALRVCAHFGVRAVILEGRDSASFGTAARTAAGAAEMIDIVTVPDVQDLLPVLHKGGYRLLPTSSHKGRNIFAFRLPRRSVIVFGSETHGVRPELLEAADFTLRIPGSGAIESLNMSCAAGIVLGEWWQQHGPK